MNKEDYELAKEVLSKIISKNLEDDMDYGKKLLAICNNKLKPCPVEVLANTYMDNMERKYGIFNKMYNIANGRIGNNSTVTAPKCNFLETQVWIIEKVKEVKDCKEDLDKVNKLLNLLKEVSE